MTVLKLIGLSGEIPRLISRLLPDGAADVAFNTRLDDGGLTPMRLPHFTHHFPSGVPADGFNTIYLNGDEWLGWGNVVYAVPGPVAADRLYVFGDGVPKLRVAGVDYGLAVAAPAVALTATVTGSATTPGTNTTRLYVYTNVTQFAEESEPSPISNEADWSPGQGVTLSGFSTTMANGRTAQTQRIYRSQTGQTGTQLFLVAERAASTADFADTVPVDAISDPLPSKSYNPPPDTLTGVISMPNGMMAGFADKKIYFCEPWIPHAWPEKYIMTVDYKIVGLAAYGTTLVVMTEGNPYIISGTAPESMTSDKLELNLPCINERGIQDLGYGVAYPSHDGIVLVSSGSANVISNNLFTREKWQALLPRTMVSGKFNGRYLTCYRYSDTDLNEYSGTLIIDMTGAQPFIIRSDVVPDAYYYDIVSGNLYFSIGADVFIWDAPGEVNALQYWRSKELVLPRPTNFGAILIEASEDITDAELAAREAMRADLIAENEAMIAAGALGGTLNGGAINVYPINGDMLKNVPSVNSTISVSVFADGEHVATVDTVNRMARLPSGFLATRWAIGVASDIEVLQIALATTGAELMGV